MMKKNGFTLAEVLITLTIIGVVAMMTLPALMTNVQEQQAKTALKKGINTLTEAAQMNVAISGFGYDDLSGSGAKTLENLLKERANVDLIKSGTTSAAATAVGASGNYVIFFRDGSAVSFKADETTTGQTLAPDGLPVGFGVKYDTNGEKQPNIFSNCAGSTSATAIADGSADVSECDTKSKRVIKDQFALKLRGTHAVPVGAASKWAYDN